MSLAAAGPSDPILMSFITENRLSRRRWGAGRRLATVLTACVVLASSFVFADDLVNPLAGDSVAAGKGEELFARNCQQCHNSRGKGGKCPQLVRGAWGPGGANSDGFMYRIIAGGGPARRWAPSATISRMKRSGRSSPSCVRKRGASRPPRQRARTTITTGDLGVRARRAHGPPLQCGQSSEFEGDCSVRCPLAAFLDPMTPEFP